jgi:acyl-CoA thioester hydrolase
VDVLHRTSVTPDEIDHLGHMNVHFYGVHARTGAEHLLGALGLVTTDAQVVVQTDTYVRHHREQRDGAALELRGGVLDATTDQVRLYEELANPDAGELAATFVLTFRLVERTTRAPMALPSDVLVAARERRVELPEHGRSRSVSIDDDVVASSPALDVLEQRDLAHRKVRTLGDLECDDDGFAAPLAIAPLVWGGEPLPGRAFQPLHELADGGQMGFATMETRSTWARVPRAGDRVQSFGAEVERGDKTMLTRNWVFDVDRRDLVAVFSVVNVAFDTTSRRAISMPEDLRRHWDSRFHPDLA